jgi:hypothetical protein
MAENDPTAPLLEKLTPQVRALVQQLRGLVTEVAPETSGQVFW